MSFDNSHKRSWCHSAVIITAMTFCRYKEGQMLPPWPYFTVPECHWWRPTPAPKAGRVLNVTFSIAEGGCFSTPSFHPETKTGCGPPSASGPGSVKETLHRQGSCIDVQVLIYLLCNQSVLCCVVLSCACPKRCCNARFLHFFPPDSSTQFHATFSRPFTRIC